MMLIAIHQITGRHMLQDSNLQKDINNESIMMNVAS
jgi:hypothetical protein